MRILESTLNTFGHADVEPTPLSAQRELQRFLEEGQAGRIKLIVHYWFKRPRMGEKIRDLYRKMEIKSALPIRKFSITSVAALTRQPLPRFSTRTRHLPIMSQPLRARRCR